MYTAIRANIYTAIIATIYTAIRAKIYIAIEAKIYIAIRTSLGRTGAAHVLVSTTWVPRTQFSLVPSAIVFTTWVRRQDYRKLKTLKLS